MLFYFVRLKISKIRNKRGTINWFGFTYIDIEEDLIIDRFTREIKRSVLYFFDYLYRYFILFNSYFYQIINNNIIYKIIRKKKTVNFFREERIPPEILLYIKIFI